MSGAAAADKENMLACLKQHSLACLPEGIAGIFKGASPDREAIYFRNRKGFVKVAIEAGAGDPWLPGSQVCSVGQTGRALMATRALYTTLNSWRST